MNILIPMAGEGKRFSDVGYTTQKPLIPVLGKPMIQSVYENLNVDANYIFIIQKKHLQEGNFEEILKSIDPNCRIILVDELTEGPASTCLLAEKLINDEPLMIINCDQMIHDFNMNYLIEFMMNTNADGVLGAFISTSNKNSYMKLDDEGKVIEVKEKIVISNIATNGLHIWKKGSDFVESAKEMITINERYNNEFYIAPSYNNLIKKGKKILPFFYNLHFPIGTPEDLEKYQKKYEFI